MQTDERSEQIRLFTHHVPKIELHLHLEGSISPAMFLRLARRNGVRLPADTEAGMAKLFQYRHFGDFLTTFMQLVQALRTGQDFAESAYELSHQLADQGIIYAEVMLSVAQYINRGIDLSEVVQGAAEGFARGQQERGTAVQLVFDYGRQFGVDGAWRAFEAALRHRDVVAGFSIGGDELRYPPEIYAEVFAAAHAHGVPVMAHAGEVAGPESVWGAIDALGVQRIGHGIRSVDDPTLLDTLRQRNITLDVCLTSNLMTGAVSSLAAHPLRQLLQAGVPLTLNTDDPSFFHTTLIEEYQRAARHCGLTIDDLATTLRTAANAAFLPDLARQQVRQQIEAGIHRAAATAGYALR